MAGFTELDAIVNDASLQARVKASALIQAQAWMLSGATPTPNQKAWARRMLLNPEGDVRALTWAVVIANRSFDAGVIVSAGDAAVQTAVNNVLPQFAEMG